MSTENIIRTYAQATPGQLRAGEYWYGHAQDIAREMVKGTDYSLQQVVGVIAALSPINPWEQNVKLAQKMIDSRGTLDEGYLKNGLKKARAILNGEDPWELLTSQKVRAFFECILYRGQTDIVCVDRHALSIWRGYDVTDTRMGAPLFRKIAADYQEAAIEAGIPAAQLQAITWVVWRER
jgi:hypothetical protein